MSKKQNVPRPIKRSEYILIFLSREVEKGWIDCLAAARNAMVEAWERLTTQPTVESPRQYRLRGDLRYGTHDGRTYERFQYKITNGGRIWYFVKPAAKGEKYAGHVLLERCSPAHPKETE